MEEIWKDIKRYEGLYLYQVSNLGRVRSLGHPVRQLDIKTGETIKEYGSMEEAARQLNIKSPSNIRGCIIGRQKSCAGYKWEYIK